MNTIRAFQLNSLSLEAQAQPDVRPAPLQTGTPYTITVKAVDKYGNSALMSAVQVNRSN